MPGIFIFILIVVALTAIGAPIADGIARRISKGGSSGSAEDVARLTAELERATQRLEDTERRLQQAEDRLDFQEKLLSARSSTPREN